MEKVTRSSIGFVVKQALEVPIERIRRFEGQPRHHFDQESIRLLSQSLGSIGQIDPVLLIQVFDDRHYTHELVDGERRIRSAKQAGKETVLAVEVELKTIPGVSPKDVQFIISALSNFGHQDHEPLETAEALYRTQNALKVSQAELAQMFGHSVPWVINHLNLLKLTPAVQKLMNPQVPEDRRLKPASALVLVGLPEETQLDIAMKAVENKWTRSQVAQAVRQLVRGGHITKENSRARKPSDDFYLIEKTLIMLDERLLTIGDIPLSSMTNTIQARGPQAKAAMVSTLNRAIETLTEFRDAVRRIDLEPRRVRAIS